MKAIKFLAVIIIITILSSCNNQNVSKKELKSDIDTVSYVIGLDMAFKLKQNFSEVDENLFMQGFMNGIDSTDILIENNKIEGVIRNFFQKKQFEQQEKQKAEAIKKVEEEFADVKNEGVEFLEVNSSKESVQTTESGLQYIVLKEGSGDKPSANSKVKVHYHGTSIDGSVFDSSVDKGEPSEFFANQVIKGWTEGLQLMKVGSKFKFFIPQELAYGAFPRQGGPIKPFETLIFEVELLDIIE
ncbi:MAG: FKBP-type peptidyl-prolyl cis-trans isomerase [Aureibaculum sp.]|nr:FKBP-type peptidyl-prolyl cis-trans isomerase [Aureibaculum sp.]